MRMLASSLRQRGFHVITTREPGGTALGERLRAALLDTEEQVDPLAELLLYAADRAQHVRTLLRPALDAGEIVLSDRYSDATLAYQGAGRGFTPSVVEQVVALATEGLVPDLTLLFDVSAETAVERSVRRVNHGRNKDRLDAEDLGFYVRVRRAYLELAAASPGRFRIIDSEASTEEVHVVVMNEVLPFLERSGKRPLEVEQRPPLPGATPDG